MDFNGTRGSTGLTGSLDLSFLTGLGNGTSTSSNFQQTGGSGFLIAAAQPVSVRPQSNVIVFGNHRMMLAPAKPLFPTSLADSNTGCTVGKKIPAKPECKVKLPETLPSISLPSPPSTTVKLEDLPSKKASKSNRGSDDIKPSRKRKKVVTDVKKSDGTTDLINSHQEMDAALDLSTKKPKKQSAKSKSLSSATSSTPPTEGSRKKRRKTDGEKKRKNVKDGKKDVAIMGDLDQSEASVGYSDTQKNDERAETMRQLGLILGLESGNSNNTTNKVPNPIPSQRVPSPTPLLVQIHNPTAGNLIPGHHETINPPKPVESRLVPLEAPRFENDVKATIETQPSNQPSPLTHLTETEGIIDFSSFDKPIIGEPVVVVNNSDIATSPKWKLLSYRNSIYSYKSSENGRIYAFSRNSFKGRSVYLQALTKILFQPEEETHS